MKIVHVITGLKDGGAEGALVRLVAATPHHDHEVVSLTGEGRHVASLEALGIPVHLLDLSPWRVPAVLRQLTALLKDCRPDVVQTWMPHADLVGGIAARRAGVAKVFWNLRNQYFDGWSRSTRILCHLNARLADRIPTRIVAVSEPAWDSFRALGFPADKGVIIENGIDVERFRAYPQARDRVRRELGLDADIFLLGRVGRFSKQKDYPTLLAALEQLPSEGNWRMVFVGTGFEEGGEGHALVASSRVADRAIMLPAQARIEDIHNALDLHVSTSKVEGFPNVLAEAMACGTPCVTTPAGAARRIVGNTGWVTDFEDPASTAGAIREAMTERSDAVGWAQRLDAARRKIVDHHSMAAMVAAYESLWREGGR